MSIILCMKCQAYISNVYFYESIFQLDKKIMHRVCINTYFHISSVHFHVFGNLTQFCRSMKVLLAKEKERNQIICLKFSHSLIVSVCPSSYIMPIYFMHVLLYIRCSIRILINATNLKYRRFMANNKIVHSKQDLASLNRNAWVCNNQKYQQIFSTIYKYE